MTVGKVPSISIFFPCYNDSETIGKLIKDATQIARKITNKFEVIVVDDASTDKSQQLLEKLSQKNPNLKLILHKKNSGYGGALKSGFKASSKELIFYTDGDGQYDVKEFPVLYSLMTPDVDFINGIKMSRHDPTYRIFIGNLYSFLARWLFFLPIYDVDCDFRLIRRDLIKKLKLESNSGSICVELVKKAQRKEARFRQVSVHHFEREFGQSQFFRVDRIFNTFRELINLWVKLMVIRY